jgi:demethylmenaquinone methyltransferase / 2-methoxy-6-polyprenyl-1,4-benzoquinol methylase
MAATVEDTVWAVEGERKRLAVQQMFGELAPTYDLINGLMSFSIHRQWRKKAVRLLTLTEGQKALDVCCGTGDFLPILRKSVGATGEAVGIDFSAPMLQQAIKKRTGCVALGDACQLPVLSNHFDGVTVGWGIRNVPDIDQAHQEIARVLKVGGRYVSLDMARPSNPIVRTISEFLFNTAVPALGRLFGRSKAYTYLPKSTQKFWTREKLAASMRSAGFVDVRYIDLMMGNICIHYGRKAEPPKSSPISLTGEDRP